MENGIKSVGKFPNPDTQFKEGNPGGGRTKGTRNRKKIERDAILEGADQQVVDQMTAAIIKKANDGDVAAFRELMDSAYGKIVDKSESVQMVTVMPSITITTPDGNRNNLTFDVGTPIETLADE